MPEKKHKRLVTSERLTINKPSELCQILFYDENSKGITATVTSMEIDLINYILYESRKSIISNNLPYDQETSFKLTLDLKDIAKTFGKYDSGNFESIIRHLRDLRMKEVKINVLQKNKDLVKSYTSFVHKVSVISNKYEKRQRVSLLIDGEIIGMVLNVKNYFSKMHLSIQYSLQLKQTKLLYELLKDYENIKTKTIDYDLVLGLLNSNSERNKKFAYFNNDILKKAINEINDKSDIRVTYEPIKERLDGGRANVTKVKFNITKQPESRLIELGLLQQTITSNKFYSKSKNKLDKLVKNGYKVIDEEMWIETDINKNEERYDAEMRIDEWLKNTHKDVRNEIYELLAKTMDDCDEQFIYIDGYLIRGVFSNDAYTKNPMETIELMNNLLSSIDYESDD